MRSRWAILFIFLYLLAMLRPVMPLFEFVVNQDYIAEFLCVNKANTQLNCNGKCYLMQRLNEQNDEKKENLPRIALEEYPIGFIDLISLKHGIETATSQENTFVYLENYSLLFEKNRFRPPHSIS